MDAKTREALQAERDRNAERLREAEAIIEWIGHHYANQDMGHKEFRVEAYARCEAFLAKE